MNKLISQRMDNWMGLANYFGRDIYNWVCFDLRRQYNIFVKQTFKDSLP